MNCRIAHITDLHWRKAIPGTSGCPNRQSRLMPYALRDALHKMKEQEVDLITITGDLLDVPEGELSATLLSQITEDYTEMKALLDDCGTEYICIPGNHDHLDSYFKVFGEKRTKEACGYEFVSFFDHAPWPDDVYRQGEDMATFEKSLNSTGPRNQIHLQHYLLYQTSLGDQYLPYGMTEADPSELVRKRLDKSLSNHANTDSEGLLSKAQGSSRPKLFLSGHFHRGVQLNKVGDFYIHASPSFCENECSYALLEVSEKEVKSQLVSLSEEIASTSIEFPYVRKGSWYKGSLHTHCKESSGCSNTPLTTGVEMYSRKNYDFMAITDHDKITDLSEVRKDNPDIVFFEGFEHSVTNHMLFISETIDPYYEIEDKKEALKSAREELTVVCHPQGPKKDYWTVDELKTYPVLPTGVEVFNGHYGAPGWRLAGAGWDYTDFWTECLDNNIKLFAYANDDYHEHDKDFGNGWNQVFSKGNAPSDILSSLKSGSCYATTGLLIHNLHEYRGRVIICFENEVKGTFYGPNHEVLFTERSQCFEYQHEEEAYFRFEAENNGRKCWTQAFHKRQD